jgi:histone chaperone ASF1
MSVVTLLDVKVLNNPAPFNASYQFEITFESLENLNRDLEWKLTYVGSAQRYGFLDFSPNLCSPFVL